MYLLVFVVRLDLCVRESLREHDAIINHIYRVCLSGSSVVVFTFDIYLCVFSTECVLRGGMLLGVVLLLL